MHRSSISAAAATATITNIFTILLVLYYAIYQNAAFSLTESNYYIPNYDENAEKMQIIEN